VSSGVEINSFGEEGKVGYNGKLGTINALLQRWSKGADSGREADLSGGILTRDRNRHISSDLRGIEHGAKVSPQLILHNGSVKAEGGTP
jgi:hypothetical protein